MIAPIAGLHARAGRDVLHRTPPFGRQSVEQVRVHVVSHSDRKDPAAADPRGRVRGDAVGSVLPHRRHAVAHQHDLLQTLRVSRLSSAASSAPARLVPPSAARPSTNSRASLRFAALAATACSRNGAHRARERDDAEPVVRAEGAQRLLQRRLGLLELGARHRARDIHHQGEIARNRIAPAGRARSEQQHEVSVLAARRVGQQRGPGHGPPQREQQLDIAGGAGRDRDHEPPPSRRLSMVCVGEYGVPYRSPRSTSIAQLGRPIGAPNAEGVAEPQGVALPLSSWVYRSATRRVSPGLDGEDLGPHQAVAGEGEQRGILPPAHDALVDVARLAGVHRLASQLLVVGPERESGERRLAGERVEITAFGDQRPVVPEALLDLNQGHPILDLDRDLGPDPRDRPRRCLGSPAFDLHPSLGKTRAATECTGPRGPAAGIGGTRDRSGIGFREMHPVRRLARII